MRWSLNAAEGSRPAEDRALRILYEKQAGALYSYVLRLLDGDRHRAEDIVQETLVRCWQHHELDEDAELLRPWLFRVARNLVMDDYRARRIRPREVECAAWLADVHAETDGFEQVLSGVVVSEALGKLSAPQRDVLILLYFHGMTTQEASRTLRVPPGTVKSRAFYGLRMLRAALQPPDPGSAEGPLRSEAA
ncbi:sigma-70 family RNA polymerase sigma factor [Streptomyces parvulus]|uniref:RNA polymerase subunit sigma-70 n=1 Tax=Streptomyces parvulus TaxID=146923 RepID=A0A369UWG8_9ACTN|nr:sigma-70 family RNA polymerase sigma factor [Streptomyces parvulus]RDD84355.1 RNA polymerase subunit sigma-70 [Streptomyces parvulus]